MGYEKHEITPKDRRDIFNEVESGKLQKDVADEFGISEAYVSKIVKESKPKTRQNAKSLESVPIEKLFNQLTEISRQIDERYDEKSHRKLAVTTLSQQITNNNKHLLETDDAELKRIIEASMSATQRRIVWNEDHKTLDAHLMDLYAEQLSIFRELYRRGDSFPPRYLILRHAGYFFNVAGEACGVKRT